VAGYIKAEKVTKREDLMALSEMLASPDSYFFSDGWKRK
jgi:hypothetical protein